MITMESMLVWHGMVWCGMVYNGVGWSYPSWCLKGSVLEINNFKRCLVNGSNNHIYSYLLMNKIGGM